MFRRPRGPDGCAPRGLIKLQAKYPDIVGAQASDPTGLVAHKPDQLRPSAKAILKHWNHRRIGCANSLYRQFAILKHDSPGSANFLQFRRIKFDQAGV